MSKITHLSVGQDAKLREDTMTEVKRSLTGHETERTYHTIFARTFTRRKAEALANLNAKFEREESTK